MICASLSDCALEKPGATRNPTTVSKRCHISFHCAIPCTARLPQTSRVLRVWLGSTLEVRLEVGKVPSQDRVELYSVWGGVVTLL